MIVPCLWVTNDVGGMCRGFADEGLLEAVLNRTIWTPADPIVFEHHELAGVPWPDVEGAVVVLPARHNCTPEQVDWFLGELDRLAWSVVVLAGDEGREFPWRQIVESDHRKLWVMQPFPEHEGVSGRLPGGWYPGTREGVRHGASRDHRPFDWCFAGQVTHQRRQDVAAQLRGMAGGFFHETDRYFDTSTLSQAEYWEKVASAKIVPCPSGPLTVDTARAFEAMEAGCVPLLDIVSPGEAPWDYWTFLLGDMPAPRVEDWATLPALIAEQLVGWQGRANRVGAAWQQWKRRTVKAFDRDVRSVSGWPAHADLPDGQITVIVTTSPIPSHPSTGILDETMASIRAQLPTADIVVSVDGVRPEQADRTADYDEYVRRVVWCCQHEWRNTVPLVLPEWGHQANLVRAALTLVDTPLVLLVEHDTPLVGDIDWAAVCRPILSGALNVVRFHHEASILDDHRYMMLDPDVPIEVDGCPVYRSAQFWARPHVATAEFYRHRIMGLLPAEGRSFVEDVIYGHVYRDWLDRGEEGWDGWRIAIYGPPGDMKRSTHIDGRGVDPKYDQTFA